VVWAIIGAGTGLVLTPAGRVLRRSSRASDRPAVFAAQFSLSHACWLPAYPIAGWPATGAGFTATWIVLAALGLAGLAGAARWWPRFDPGVLTHTHDDAGDPGHLVDAVLGADDALRHSHEFVIDADHRRWPVGSRRPRRSARLRAPPAPRRCC
jgi:hypothetical protein